MKYINELCERRKNLSPLKEDIIKAAETMMKCYSGGNKVLICGNGGSSADSSHMVGELLKGFKKKRTITETLEADGQLVNKVDISGGQLTIDSKYK